MRRLAVGEIVTAADGTGAWREYAVTETAPSRLVLEARAPVQRASDDTNGVSLAVALTKGGLDDVVAATTELGVERVTPVRTERTVVRWDRARAQKAVDRLRGVAREAAMQSRRATIPVVDDVTDVAALRDRPGLVIASLGGVAAWELPPRPGRPGPAGWTVLVGPEGGFGPEELAGFAAVPCLRLAPNVLRAVHAPVAAVAVLGHEAERRRSGPQPVE